MRARGSAAFAVIGSVALLLGCAGPSDIWISTTGPPINDWPPQPIVIEAGNLAWVLEPGLGGGTLLVSSSEAVPTRALRGDDCSEIATFTVQPNSRYIVRIDAAGLATVREVEGVEMGPGLGQPQPSPCS